ncbi:MAG: metal-dependent hydrolase [Deltaproteobacteria bacterium]|jgi:L-ascorbate metabolism protein UlaG (beta-lactamase superfamily)|nr:metal-dependent hydrolase [Deltaproteobacteria bacterium]
MSANRLTWHGHSTFQIFTPDCSVIIDPFFSGNPRAISSWEDIPPPDIVLVTHLHADHAGDAAALCRRFKARLGAVTGTAASVKGVPPEQILNGVGFNIGGTLLEKGLSITLTEATHTSDAGTPTGFILTLPDGFTIYHAGDTGIFPGMKLWGELYPLDLALLPMGGVFTMDARQAALAAKLLKTREVVPMHWGTFPVLAQETETFGALLQKTAPGCRFTPMSIGQSISLDRRTPLA